MAARPTQCQKFCGSSRQPLNKFIRLTSMFAWVLALTNLATNAQEAKPDQSIEPAGTSSRAGEQGARTKDRMPSGGSISICQLVEAAAAANRLPLEFFARVIWQESRFRPDVVGPVTRSGRQAQGIAQFMPMTA